MTWTFDRAAEFLAPRLWYAKVACLFVWGSWIGSLALGNWTFDVVGQLVGVDHLAFYSPARMIRDGRGAEIYDFGPAWEFQKSLLPPGTWDDQFEAFRNPPFYALLYVPTAGLSYGASFWIWAAVGMGLFALGVRWLEPVGPRTSTVWAITFLPVFSAVSYGQNTLLSFGVVCGTYRLLALGRPFLAGLLAGLLWFKPPLLLGFVVWGMLDLRRLWPAAAGVVVTGAVLTVGTYPIVPGAWQAFTNTLASNAAFDGFDQWKMQNPRAFWRLLLPTPIPLAGPWQVAGKEFGPLTLQTALWLLSAGAGVWAFVRVWRANRDRLPVVFAASVFLMLWASPHAMVYEWALAAVPAVLLWRHAPEWRRVWVVMFAVGWLALFVGTDTSRIVIWLERKLFGWETPVVFHVSIPLLAWVGWQATRVLTADAGRLDGPAASGSGPPPPSAP